MPELWRVADVIVYFQGVPCQCLDETVCTACTCGMVAGSTPHTYMYNVHVLYVLLSYVWNTTEVGN